MRNHRNFIYIYANITSAKIEVSSKDNNTRQATMDLVSGIFRKGLIDNSKII